MQFVSTYMKIKSGYELKYRLEHRNIWPEVEEGISKYGIRNYSIFMKELMLYSYFEVEDLDKTMSQLAQDYNNQRWQKHMTKYFDISSGINNGKTVYLKEILHMEGDNSELAINRIGSLVKINKQIVEDYEKVHHNFKTAMLQRIDKDKIKNSRIFVHGNNLFIYFEASNINDGMFMCSADKEQQKDNKISLNEFISSIPECSNIFLDEVYHID